MTIEDILVARLMQELGPYLKEQNDRFDAMTALLREKDQSLSTMLGHLSTLVGQQSGMSELITQAQTDLAARMDAVAATQASNHAAILALLDNEPPAQPEEPSEPGEPDPTNPEEPAEPAEPTNPVEPPVAVSAKINAFTDNAYWNKGIGRQKAGFTIPHSSANEAAFVKGAHAKFADDQVRRINYVQVVGSNMSVWVDGPLLDPALVGSPNSVFITNEDINETPIPEPEQPGEPVNPDPVFVDGGGPLVGANFAGMANNPWFNDDTKPASSGTHYRTSAKRSNQGDYFANFGQHGPFLNRQPYALERLFRIIDGQPRLQEGYAAEMEEMMDQAYAKGGMTILDMHNYCRVYQNTPYNADGSRVYPRLLHKTSTVNGVSVDTQWFPINHPGCKWNYDLLAQAYGMIAQRFGEHPGLLAYGLMNEPHNRTNVNGINQDDGVDVQGLWEVHSFDLYRAIREFDTEAWITFAGNAYSTAKHCRKVNGAFYGKFEGLHRVMCELHQYPDTNGDGGGSWPTSRQHSVDPVARVNDWVDAIAWCEEQDLPLLAGEFGGPVDFHYNGTAYEVPGMEEYLEQLHQLFDQHGVLRTQWLAGPGKNDDYANGLDKADGTFKRNADATIARVGMVADQY